MSIILLLHLFMLTFTFGHVELLTVDYHSIDTPIVELNNHTLREVFEGGNLVVNYGNPYLNLNGYNSVGATSSIVNNEINTLATNQGGSLRYIFTTINNNTYYFVSKNKSTSNQVGLRFKNGAIFTDLELQSLINEYQILSGKVTATSGNVNDYVYIGDNRISNFDTFYTVYLYGINQTSLGISSLTVEQMDSYFEMYQDNISANDVTYTQNEMTITDLTYILGFSFVWFIIIWSIRKVVL